MTYKDIYDKFLIEYDKATASASYPSFTKLEICTFLDKAYLSLISQKLTGNNPRGVGFEGDIKAIDDLKGLVVTSTFGLLDSYNGVYNIFVSSNMPSLYILSAVVVTQMDPELIGPSEITEHNGHIVMSDTKGYTIGIDSRVALGNSKLCKLVSKDVALKSFLTDTNFPRVKTPLMFIDNGQVLVVVDPLDVERGEYRGSDKYIIIRYIAQPQKFYTNVFHPNTTFALSDHMAEELVNIAVVMALENIESPRTQTKVQLNNIES